MTSRRLAVIAPALAAVCVAAHQIAYGFADAAQWTFSLGFIVYAAVGGLIVDRYPRNPVGWLFCVVGVVFAAGDFVSDYASHTGNPGSTGLALLNTATGPSTLLILGLALMLFPTGRFLSRGWRGAALALIALNAALSLVLLLEPGPLADTPAVVNPLGVETAAGLLHTLSDLGGIVVVATVLIAVAAVIARFRAVHGLERQQLKWLVLAGLVGLGLLALLLALDQLTNLETGTGQVVAGVILGAISTGPAVAVAVAILRYRLYDVDVVINRALVYGALTALLGATYLGLVLLVGLAVGKSGFAVAVSTLAVAALFRPARARVQAAVDHRFYRRRYVAEQVVAGLGARLRDQVELDALSRELRGVVDECLQPAHVSLWLRAVR